MNFTILWICLITILGAILRIICIDKDGGLWNDEYVSWAIASIPFGKGFIHGVLSQCHMPFYYLYLKFWLIFSNDDTYLRVTSVIPAILSIPVMYFVGKEKNKLTGYMCALFTALSSLLIYYAQEVRFYSLLFLFSGLSLYFTIKVLKRPRKRNLTGLVLSNLLILATHTIGVIYVFFDLAFITVKKIRLYRKFIITSWCITIATFLGFIPLLYKILTTVSFSQWWANLNLYRIIQVFADYFTPIISNVSVVENIHGINFISIFMIIPLLIATIAIIAGIFEKDLRFENQIGYIALLTFIVALLLSATGKFVLNAKYIIEIYPILILAFCSTIDSCNKNWFKVSIFSIFFLFQFCFVISPQYSAKLPREEGNKYVADLINNAKLKKNDIVVFTYYPIERFKKYIDFSKYQYFEFHKGNFNDYFEPYLTYHDAILQGKNKYRGTFYNSILPNNRYSGSKFIYILNDLTYSKMKKNQKIAFIFLDSVSFLDEGIFSAIVTNNDNYKKTPLPYLIFSDFRNEIIRTIPKNARNLHYESKGAWTLVSFQY